MIAARSADQYRELPPHLPPPPPPLPPPPPPPSQAGWLQGAAVIIEGLPNMAQVPIEQQNVEYQPSHSLVTVCRQGV